MLSFLDSFVAASFQVERHRTRGDFATFVSVPKGIFIRL